MKPVYALSYHQFCASLEVAKIDDTNMEQGKQIVDFVIANKDVYNFIVHCAAGISRSGAIAKFINEYFGGDEWHFKHLNPHTNPNMRILSILRNLNQEHGQEDIIEG